MKIKTTVRCHLTTLRMAVIKKCTNNKCWGGFGEKGRLVHSWWNVNWCSHYWKQVCRFLKKLKIELRYDPAIPLLGIYPKKKMKTLIWKDRASLVAQWLRSSCQCRGHGFKPWSGKIPHAVEQLSLCTTTTEPVLQSPRAKTTKPTCHNYWSPCT